MKRALPILLLLWLGGLAQASPPTPTSYSIRHWTTDDGLPQNRISALAQTADGYVWCGTWFGLVRFDGVRFTVLNEGNTPALKNDDINALAVDQADGALWIGTREGLLRWHAGRFQRFDLDPASPERVVWRLLARPGGGVWAVWGRSLATVSALKIEWSLPLPPFPNSGPELVRDLVAERDGALFFVMDSGLKRVRPRDDRIEAVSGTLSEPISWQTVSLDERGQPVLVGSEQGLARRQGSGWEWLADSRPTGGRDISLLHHGPDGAVWCGVRGLGVCRVTAAGLVALPLLSGGPVTELVCALNDREGGLWLGTVDGLFRAQAKAARTLTTRDGLPHDEVWLAQAAHDGAVWLGTGGGVARVRGDRVETFADEPHPQHRSGSLWGDAAGGLWLEKDGQIFLRRENEPFRQMTGLGHVNCLYGDRADRLWIAGKPADSMRVWQGGQFIRPPEELPPDAEVKVIHEARDGAFWFGTQHHGLLGWHQGKLRHFTRRDGLASDAVWAIHEDAEGVLWLGGERGLTRMEMRTADPSQSLSKSAPPPARVGDEVRSLHLASGAAPRERSGEAKPGQSLLTSAPTQTRVFAFRPPHGLPAEEINQVLEDDFGHLWLGTLRGVLRVRRSALDAITAGKAERAAVAVFGVADGMESETNGERQPAGCKTRDGRIWFPTTRGIAVFDPRTLPRDENPPAVVIEEVVADGESVSGFGFRVPSFGFRARDRHCQPDT